MSKPKRIQRQRTKGFRLADECKNPNGYVIVSRPSVYGNPYKIGQRYEYVFIENSHSKLLFMDAAMVQRRFERWLKFKLSIYPNFLEPLRGKDLVCWCSHDHWCHADTLLELANEETE